MDNYNNTKISDVKSRVRAMLKEQGELVKNGGMTIMSASKYWSDFCSYFDYMLELPEASFSKIRLHTYHLTGDNYQLYYFGSPDIFKAENNLDELVKDIPPAFILNEPKGGIGFSYANGRFVSADIVRYQRVVNTLFRQGILSGLRGGGRHERKHLLEIGGGYGALAHHLSNILEDVTYVIVDLPETLLFSAAYLLSLDPDSRIYLYDKNTFPDFITSDAVESYDFILVPNYALRSLRHLRFELVINIASFQEMRAEQVNEYLDFIDKVCAGALYSYNMDAQPRNKELLNLSEIFKARFEAKEVFQPDEKDVSLDTARSRLKRALRSIALHAGLLDRPAKASLYPKYREFICRPLSGTKTDQKNEGVA